MLIHPLKSYSHRFDPLNCYASLQSDDLVAADDHRRRQGPYSFASIASREVGIEQDWHSLYQLRLRRCCNDASALHMCRIRQVSQRLQKRSTITAAAAATGIERPG